LFCQLILVKKCLRESIKFPYVFLNQRVRLHSCIFLSIIPRIFNLHLFPTRASVQLKLAKFVSLNLSCNVARLEGFHGKISNVTRGFIFCFLLISGFVFSAHNLSAVPKITIVWSTQTNGSEALYNDEGVALSAGIQGNGDGDLVELGYFSEGDQSDPFRGIWIPLTQNTHVGDSSTGYGFDDGMFSFMTTFYKDSDHIKIYPTEPKEFTERLPEPITSQSPPKNKPICIRFYDAPTKGGAKYNTVTGDDWLWPGFPNGTSIPSNLYWKIASGSAPSGSIWSYGSTFQETSDSFVASILPKHDIHFEVLPGAENLGTIKINDQNTTFTFNAQPYGTIFNLKAIPGPHSYFNRWVGTGIDEFWEENITFRLESDQNISAEFAKVPYLLNLSSRGEGIVYGSGSFSYGDEVLIEAHPDYGHSFTRWENNGTHYSSNQFETVSIDGDMDLVAVFIRNTYVVGKDPEPFGGSYEILDINGSTQQTYQHGLQYTLRSIPDKHFGFTSWSSSDAGLSMIAHPQSAETTFIPVADVNITAIFSELSYELNVESSQGFASINLAGNINNQSPNKGSFPATSTVDVNITWQDGFVFYYWLDPLGVLSNFDTNQTAKKAGAKADISKIYPYDRTTVSVILRLDEYEESDINITSGSGGNVLFESDNSGGLTHFSSHELNASANMGFQFNQWVGDTDQLVSGPYAPNNKVLIEGPLSLRAEFSLIEYKLNLSSTGDGTPTGPDFFTINDNTSITAFAFPGARFTHWSGDTDYLLNHLSSQTYIEIDHNSIPKDLELVANFVPENYQVSLQTEGNGSTDILLSTGEVFYKTTTQSLSVNSATQLTLDAYADNGWTFSNWRGLPDLADLYNPIAYIDQYSSIAYFYPSSDLNLTAEFKIIEYDDTQIVLTPDIGGNAILESESTGKFKHFSSYDINATPDRGYEFTGWALDSPDETFLAFSKDNPNNRLKIGGEIEINATFSPIDYEIDLDSSSGGKVDGPTSFKVSESPVITATESPGWYFSHWSGDISYLSDLNSSRPTIDHSSLPLKNLSFSANFLRESYNIHLSSEGAGSLNLSKDGAEFTTGSSQEVVLIDSGTRLGLVAQPSPGWKFSRWFGLPSPSSLRDSSPSLNPLAAEIHFIPSQEENITANFERMTFNLQIDQPDSGGNAVGSGLYLFEKVVDINATPQEHYDFHSWTGDISHLIYDANLANNKINIPDSDVSIRPLFQPKIYSVQSFADENGTFQISGVYNGVTQFNQTEYNATSNLSITALPLDDSTHMLNYLYWENSLGDSGYSYAPTFTIPYLDGNYSFWAYFTDRNDIDSLYASPPYAGSAGQNRQYSSAQFKRLIANPNSGFSFIGWESKTGESFSPHWSLHTIDSELDETSEIWAHFKPQSRFLSLQYDQNMGEISGFSNETAYGSNENLTAYADENYTFVNWELIKETTFQVKKGASSIFPPQTRLFINNEECPELSLLRGHTYHFDCNLSSGDGFYLSSSPEGDSPNSHYLSGVSGHLSSSGTFTFEVPPDAPDILYYHSSGKTYSGNRIYISSVEDSSLLPSPTNPVFSNRIIHHFGLRANFERTRHALSLTATGQGSVNHTSQDIYFWGDEIEISAIPEDHWYFSHWEGSSYLNSTTSKDTVLKIAEDTAIKAIFKQVQYIVDVNASPVEYGIITPPTQTFTFEEYISLQATPLVGKQFIQWDSLENLIPDDPEDLFKESANFKVLGNAKVRALFSKIPINVDLQLIVFDQNNQTIAGEFGGTVNRPELIYHGDSVTLEITPFTGYNFLYWEDLDSGKPLTSQKSYTSIFTSDRNLQAVLRKQHYQLEVSPSSGGSVEWNGTIPHYWKDTISLTAMPNQHWTFSHWSGVGSENLENKFSPSTVLSIQRDSTISAVFEPAKYKLEISLNPPDYGGHSSIATFYHFGDVAEIEANPRSGKLFDSWAIDANATFAGGTTSKSNPAKFEINGSTKLTAQFKSKQYQVSYQVVVVDENDTVQNGVFGGRILGGKSFYDEDVAEFSMSLSNGYKFKNWKNADTNVTLSSEKVYKHEMLSDLNLTAIVTQRKYEIDLKISPSVGGYVLLNDYNVSGNFLRDDYSYGSEINLSATANEGYRFVQWGSMGTSLGTTTNSNQSFALGNDSKITAYFAPTGLVNLSLTSDPLGAASYLFGQGSFAYNLEHSILAMPKEGYLFSHWEFNGSIAIGIVDDAYSINTSVALDSDKQLTAVFVVDDNASLPNEDSNKLYLLSVNSDNINQGTTIGSGFYRGVRTIKAFPKDGFEFSHWKGATFVNHYDAITQVSIFENTSVVAHFQSVGLFEDSETLENDWWGNPWFGYFWKIGNEDWLFHEKLGWIFMKKQGDESIWVWIQKLEQWLWTAKEHYPYLYSENSANWYWVNLNQSDFTRLVLYNFGSANPGWKIIKM